MSVCDVPVISTVCNSVGQGAGDLVAAPFDYLAQACGQAAQWMFQGVWGVYDSTTVVDITSPGYIAVYNILFGIGVFIALLFFCLQLLTGLVRRDPASLSKAAVGLAKSVIGSFLVITLTGTALEIVDELCVGIVQATGTTMDQLGARIGALAVGLTAISATAPGVGAVVTIFLAGLAIAAAALVWFSLLIRKALLLVAIVMAPVALSGSAWDVTKGWFSKWASFVLALIISKLVVVVVFLVATAQLAAPINFDLESISQPIAGVVLMFIAGFAPYMAYRFISFMGFDMYHATSAEQESKGALSRPIPLAAARASDGVKKILGSGSSSAGADGISGGSGQAPPPRPSAEVGASAGPAAAGGAGAACAGTAGDGGAGAAGPVGLAAALGAAKVAGSAATAGPKAASSVAHGAEKQAEQTGGPSAPQPASAKPTSSPQTAPRAASPAPPTAPRDESQS